MAEYLTNDTELKSVADAIRAKTGGTDALSFPAGFVSEIGTLRDTSDATVTAGDMAKGIVAYGSGGKVTGTVTETKSGKFWTCGNPMSQAAGQAGQVARVSPWGAVARRTVDTDVLLRAGATAQVAVMLSDLGGATPADVAKGKTFTSVAGVAVAGTREGLGDEVTVTLTNGIDSTLSYSFQTYKSNGGITGISTGELTAGNSQSITVRAGAIVSCALMGGGSSILLKALPDSVVQGRAESLVTFVAPSEPETPGESITVTITQA